MTLVQAGRLDVVPADQNRATAFLQRANERLGQLDLLTSVTVKYDLAYDAAHDIGEALLSAYGYRTTNAPANTRRLDAIYAPSSTPLRAIRRPRHSTICGGQGTRTTTKPPRWAPRTPSAPSR
ncbi:MAG: hypothetical protein LBL55_04940 [Propionibacteriaceae bacterium]|nr:hypothetical protein [Propionibacteriaceae bacterium]